MKQKGTQDFQRTSVLRHFDTLHSGPHYGLHFCDSMDRNLIKRERRSLTLSFFSLLFESSSAFSQCSLVLPVAPFSFIASTLLQSFVVIYPGFNQDGCCMFSHAVALRTFCESRIYSILPVGMDS